MTVGGSTDERPLIAHVIFRLQAGGMENGLINLVNNLPASKFRHAVICVTGKTDFAARLVPGRAEIFELGKRPGLDPGFYMRYWRLIRRLKPDLVHSRNLGTIDLSFLSWLARVPCRIHGEHGWEFADARGQSRKYRFLRRACNVFVTSYVAVSKSIATWLVTGIGVDGGKVSQIYNGVDADKFSPAQGDAAATLQESGSPLVVGSVGRMDPIKNFAWLVTRFGALIRAYPERFEKVSFLLVGEGPERERLERAARQEGLGDRIRFAGARNDIPDLMRRIDVFVLPSINEGISNTILEAMATGVPIVASRVGGNCELVVHGESGYLYPLDAPDAFDEALLALIDDAGKRRRFGLLARRRVEERFSLSTMLGNYCQLYERHLGC